VRPAADSEDDDDRRALATLSNADMERYFAACRRATVDAEVAPPRSLCTGSFNPVRLLIKRATRE
jgi:hypothetical protein